MQFSEIQRLIHANAERYGKKHGIEMTREFLLLKLMEETGEFAEALLVCGKQCRAEKQLDDQEAREQLAAELADIFNIVVLLAHDLDVDLLAALDKKILEKGRAYLAQTTE